jgi:hypothetical protein
MKKTLYITEGQLKEISSWMSNNPESRGASSSDGFPGVTADGFKGDDETYTSGKPVTGDEVSATMTANFFKQFGMQQGRNYRPYSYDELEDYKGHKDEFRNIDFRNAEREIELGFGELENGEDKDNEEYTNMISEEFNKMFLNKKLKASKTASDVMSPAVKDGFVDHFKEGETTLKALRQKVYNMQHGKSTEDPETQKKIVQAYNNARKVNTSVQSANKNTTDAVTASVKNSKNKSGENKPIITYFN